MYKTIKKIHKRYFKNFDLKYEKRKKILIHKAKMKWRKVETEMEKIKNNVRLY